jgi:hypothetical protein
MLDFYGSTPAGEIFEALEYAIVADDISILCLDNLQFMLSDQAIGVQKFDLQDRVISKLRQLATKYNVHIFLVVHPKKVEDDTKLTSGSIYGTSKVTQEADNVFILQKSSEGIPNYRKIELVKNRYNGITGSTHLAFNSKSRRYIELYQKEIDPYMKSNGDIKLFTESRIEKYGTIEPELYADSMANKQTARQVLYESEQMNKDKEIDYELTQSELIKDSLIKVGQQHLKLSK